MTEHHRLCKWDHAGASPVWSAQCRHQTPQHAGWYSIWPKSKSASCAASASTAVSTNEDTIIAEVTACQTRRNANAPKSIGFLLPKRLATNYAKPKDHDDHQLV